MSERIDISAMFDEEDARANERIIITAEDLDADNLPPIDEPLDSPQSSAPKELFTPGEVADIIIEEKIAREGLHSLGGNALKPLVRYAHPDNKQGLASEEKDKRVVEEISKRINAAYDDARRSESRKD